MGLLPYRGRSAGLAAGLCLVLGATLCARGPADGDAGAVHLAFFQKGKARRPAGKAGDDGALKFSRDIAPILVANCGECHGGPQPKGQFNMGTFAGLLKGGKGGAVIEPGKPGESRLVLRIKGEGDEPKMPPGQRKLAAEAVDRIAAWVKAGARLDAGNEPTAELRSYAPTAEDLRRADLAKLSPEDRDRHTEEAGLERWKKASAEGAPETTSDRAFLLLSNLPKPRATALLKTLNAQLAPVRGLLGPKSPAALNGPERISVYVFNDPNAYAEFVRAVESREAERGDQAHGRLDVETPYLAAVDPLNGGDERPASRRSRRKDDETGPERSLAGLLTEQLGNAAVNASGKAPRWLSLGVGAYFGSRVEPRSPYYLAVRKAAADLGRLGWPTRAAEALGDGADTDAARAAGFSMVEWLANTQRAAFPAFTRALAEEGGTKLYEVVKVAFNVGPEEFLNAWGAFVAARYGRLR